MRDPVDQFQHAGLNVLIYRDDSYQPDWELDASRVGKIVVEHRNFRLGDEHRLPGFQTECPRCHGEGCLTYVRLEYATTVEFSSMIGVGLGTSHDYADALRERDSQDITNDQLEHVDCPVCQGLRYVDTDPLSYFREHDGATVVLPLRVHEDWQPSLSVLPYDQWPDADGFAYSTRAGVSTCLGAGATEQQITQALTEEVAQYSHAVHGDVYAFELRDARGASLATVGAFVGDTDYVTSEAKAAAEGEAKYIVTRIAERDAALQAEQLEADRWACADVLTVGSLPVPSIPVLT